MKIIDDLRGRLRTLFASEVEKEWEEAEKLIQEAYLEAEASGAIAERNRIAKIIEGFDGWLDWFDDGEVYAKRLAVKEAFMKYLNEKL